METLFDKMMLRFWLLRGELRREAFGEPLVLSSVQRKSKEKVKDD